ncbi:hypothetical protein HYPSUDRAFT_205603 [Hypholoma sublateritium FD-334 SS-4]|uniref:Uncharacterized protein n=1 Tax=Hypholoma sublateritium (strain FD-334 SS-4) TaxID=945553 RepID=A0A0D2KU18_HYPSF|nr:hypothetical protein HYPSUDRAFT_205603 [Hypholoma sublateritium FD-334 SS-4]
MISIDRAYSLRWVDFEVFTVDDVKTSSADVFLAAHAVLRGGGVPNGLALASTIVDMPGIKSYEANGSYSPRPSSSSASPRSEPGAIGVDDPTSRLRATNLMASRAHAEQENGWTPTIVALEQVDCLEDSVQMQHGVPLCTLRLISHALRFVLAFSASGMKSGHSTSRDTSTTHCLLNAPLHWALRCRTPRRAV